MDEALVQNDLPTAQRAAHDAFVATLVTATWEGKIAVGQAYQRLAERSEWRAEALQTARREYLDAFFLARQQGSLDGLLESAAAFARLGDRAVVDQCLFFARIMAVRVGGDAPQRVAVWTERLAGSGASARMTESFWLAASVVCFGRSVETEVFPTSIRIDVRSDLEEECDDENR
jgi:hypothetical protein